MKIYAPTIPVCQLDENNYFVGMTTADLDPLESNGHYLIPRLCIEAEEPEFKAGYIAQWAGDNWQYIEDHRGETVYSKETGQEIKISELGKLPETVTTIPCPDSFHHWVEKENKWVMSPEAEAQRQQQINNERQAKINTLLSAAAEKIAAYQDMIDFAETEEEATEAEKGLLAWRKYRAALLKYQKGLIPELPSVPNE
ncbi:MAG: tail fiber assembly protein [Snodgrassella sp.]|uniref:tail fiber assembly protein n=1 Tax=Snodgrassella sp. TaxID=2815304 RepID=UPI00258BAC15|nr:tail fiber assembly protein [Snodgrassella sp.]MCO6520565.1 tail fiber assembly protein [Snodgrassella sp.]